MSITRQTPDQGRRPHPPLKTQDRLFSAGSHPRLLLLRRRAHSPPHFCKISGSLAIVAGNDRANEDGGEEAEETSKGGLSGAKHDRYFQCLCVRKRTRQ